MNKIICFCFVIFFSNASRCQNLVLNPGFEDTLDCPINANQLLFATNWYNFGQSPDYFHSCSFNPDFSTPNNWGGYQVPSSGKAYAAFGTYLSRMFGLYDTRDFCGVQLSSTLNISTKYYISFKVSLSLNDYIQSNCATNNIGALFSTTPYTWDNPPARNNFSHINYTNIITDSISWTTVFGSFVADSAYQYLIIGNFYNDLNTDTLIMGVDSNCYYGYYYLDDVCVSTDSAYTYNYITNVEETLRKNNVFVFPNPFDEFIRMMNNSDEPLVSLIIYDQYGRAVYKQAEPVNDFTKIETSYLHSGMYVLSVKYKNSVNSFKLIKL